MSAQPSPRPLRPRPQEPAARVEFVNGLRAGEVRTGTVTGVHGFGVFVALAGEPDGVRPTGFVNPAELSWEHVEHPDRIVAPGQAVTVQVLGVDDVRAQAQLSLKALRPDPLVAAADLTGTTRTGTVTKHVPPLGLFVRIAPGVEGLLRPDDADDPDGLDDPADPPPPGSRLAVRVLSVDQETRRVHLSRRPRGDWPAVPEEYAAGVRSVLPAAEADGWLDGLPGLAEEMAARWSLQPDGPPMHGFLGLALPVRGRPGATRDAGRRMLLKLSRPGAEIENQIDGLRAWDGRGMVRAVETLRHRGVVLMERLDEHRSLDDLPIGEAVEHAAALADRLAVAWPADSEPRLPTLAEHVADWPERHRSAWERLGRPLPRRLLDAAAEAVRDLAPGADRRLVHHDLHYGNVLAGEREPWLAVDPRAVVGDKEFALAPLLWTRYGGGAATSERFRRLVTGSGSDPALATGWSLARVVDYLLWAVGAGLTRDPVACAEIAERLAPPVR